MAQRILVLCTGNSCRSVMAEALLNQLGQGKYEAFSAGSFPAGYVHLKSIETLKRHGIDPGKPKKLHWSTPDPAKTVGSDVEIEAAFDQAFFMLKGNIEGLIDA